MDAYLSTFQTVLSALLHPTLQLDRLGRLFHLWSELVQDKDVLCPEPNRHDFGLFNAHFCITNKSLLFTFLNSLHLEI